MKGKGKFQLINLTNIINFLFIALHLTTKTNTANEQLNKFDYLLDFNSTGSVRENSQQTAAH